MRWRWSFFFFVLLPVMASGTTMIELPLDVLSLKSDAIVVGRCSGRTVSFNEEKTLIYTDYTFRVERVIKGKAGQEVTVRQLGGEIGDLGMGMIGTARFLPFEEVLIFTGAELEGVRPLVGLAQGKFRIITEGQTGVKYAVRDLSGLVLVRRGDAGERLKTPLRLDELIELIQSSLSEEGR